MLMRERKYANDASGERRPAVLRPIGVKRRVVSSGAHSSVTIGEAYARWLGIIKCRALWHNAGTGVRSVTDRRVNLRLSIPRSAELSNVGAPHISWIED